MMAMRRAFNYFAQKQKIKPVEQSRDDHYKKAYQENTARFKMLNDMQNPKNAQVKSEQIPLRKQTTFKH